MLELRPNCERCDRDLPPDADARICSYECTFCVECAEQALANVCPNCGGGFVPRPIRPRGEWREGTGLEHDPPGTHRRELKYTEVQIGDAGAEAPRRRAARPLGPLRQGGLARAPDRLDARVHVGSRWSTSSRPRSEAAGLPRHVVAPSQHVPSSCTRRSTSFVSASSPTRTSTWFRTTSFATSNPSSASRRSANRRASEQQRSTRSATPARPSDRSAAHVANPRARRDDSSVKSPPPNVRPSTWPERYEAT